MKISGMVLAGLMVAGLGCGTGTVTPSTHTITASTAPPSISLLTPGSVPVGSPGFNMTINGGNLGTDTVAFFNGNAQHTVFISADQIMVTLTDADLQRAGNIPIFVRTQGLNSNTLVFDVAVQ